MTRAPFLAALAVGALNAVGCGAPAPLTCTSDSACTGTDVCAFGECRTVTCNSDAECSDHTCVDGLCARTVELASDVAFPTAPTVDGCALGPVSPAADAVDVDVLAELRVELDTAESAATASMELRRGSDVIPARAIVDDTTRVLVPFGPLDGQTRYTVVVTRACGSRSWSFTTAALDLVDPSFAPRAVGWQLAASETTPAAATAIIGLLEGDSAILNARADGANLGFVKSDGVQRTCDPTLALDGPADNPRYAYAGNTTAPTATGITSVHVRGVARGSGADVGAIIVVDGRQLARRLLNTCVPGASAYPQCAAIACGYATSLGLACEPCDDGEPYCVTYAMHGVATASAPIAPQSIADVCAKPECATDDICN